MSTTTQAPALGTIVEPGESLGIFPPEGTVDFGIIVVNQKTREIFDLWGNPTDHVHVFSPDRRGPGQVLIYWSTFASSVTPVRRGEYLPYPPLDGIPIRSVPDPVNQFAIGPKWKNILSRFAHDVMAFNPSPQTICAIPALTRLDTFRRPMLQPCSRTKRLIN